METWKLAVKVVLLIVALVLFWYLWTIMNMQPVPFT